MSAAMMAAGRRVFYLKRLLKEAFGLTAADDELSARLREPAGMVFNIQQASTEDGPGIRTTAFFSGGAG
jgi:aldehyde:ferredoxin oxidoreductase